MFSRILAILGVVCASAETIRNPAKRTGAGPFFQIVRNGKWGFMDRTGRVAITPAFADERDFFHGLAAVALPEGKWGFIDESGKLSISARFDEVRDFIDDLGSNNEYCSVSTADRIKSIAPRHRAEYQTTDPR